ncbi:helicase-related protein [Mycobacterium sp. SMC-4]|uniref:helicase-related protein n=1 Tax=Mycobacterium sp. SMC-4 TaxID=2857059 RepID=UPI0021B47AFC|nr:helicase-related protein [Mycobacterium sp. SMC-4]UXA19509.1 hypothetical protein KXD98_07890 [Mycobacterium sp. SMC-4]
MTTYSEFLTRKVQFDRAYGHAAGALHSSLKPHQRDIVTWAVQGGRRAVFAQFGLGKTRMQLEIIRQSIQFRGARGLIVCPLGVRGEFRRDAEAIGMNTKFVRSPSELSDTGVYITNYETIRDGKLDPNLFAAVSLDEAGVLRSYGSKTYQTFLQLFSRVPYRYVATATPSPNRYKELIHYAGFLGVMDTGAALTRWFQRDSTKANNLTLYPHKAEEFHHWLSTWAVFLNRPSDLGYSDEGYELPDMAIEYHEVDVDHSDTPSDRDGQGFLYRGGALGVKDVAREKRDSLSSRVSEMERIILAYARRGDAQGEGQSVCAGCEACRRQPGSVAKGPGLLDQIIIWVELNDEQRAVERKLDDLGISYSSIHGSLSIEECERRLEMWRDRETVALIGKPVMLGQGMNLQQCNKAIYLGVSYKFHDFIQSQHRIQRYGQTRTCRTHIIHAESEREVVRALRDKWTQHKELNHRMTEIVKEVGLRPADVVDVLKRSIGVERIEASGDGWLAANNDCVPETRDMEGDSVDLIVTSIPFANHYEYTPAVEDFGHTDNNDHFWRQMDYLSPQLLRILKPGRIYCCHVKDRILFGNVTGAGVPTVSPFHAEAIFHAQEHGFDYLGMITVVTDVVRENNQTYRLGWSEQCKDATKMGVGSPEYILLFHKPQSDRSKGYADTPVTKDKAIYTRARWQIDAHAFWRSSGNRLLTTDELAQLPADQLSRIFTEQTLREVYDYESHVRIGEHLDGRGALPATFMSLAPGSWSPEVWHDINRMLTLNTTQSQRAQQMHVCLARDSLVLTRGGYKPIQQVGTGELVLTHRGRWRPVLAVQNTGVRPVVNLRAHGVPHAVMTPDHKVWTRDPRAYARESDYLRKVNPDWAEAAQTVGAYVNKKLAPEEHPSTSDRRVWWTVGRWLADGHIDARGCVILSCGAHEVDDLSARLGPFVGRTFRPTSSGAARQVQLHDPDRALRNILKTCGHGAANKHLPQEAYTLPAAEAAAILDGYLSGDGHYRPDRRRWMASSVSRELMLGVAYLAQRVHGAVASVYPGRPDRDGTILGRQVRMRQEWGLSFDLPDESRRKHPHVLDDGAWMRVRSAEPVGEVETWNLRVAEDESYHADGMVVKNCPLQFDIVDRLINRFSNPGELVFDPFGGLMTVPVRALKLGRRGRAVELNPGYFLDGVKYLQAEEHRRDMPSLFDIDSEVVA